MTTVKIHNCILLNAIRSSIKFLLITLRRKNCWLVVAREKFVQKRSRRRHLEWKFCYPIEVTFCGAFDRTSNMLFGFCFLLISCFSLKIVSYQLWSHKNYLIQKIFIYIKYYAIEKNDWWVCAKMLIQLTSLLLT